jgi:hypothetical protein
MVNCCHHCLTLLSFCILHDHRQTIGNIVGGFDLDNQFSIGALAQVIQAAPNIYNDEETTNMIRGLHANTNLYEGKLAAAVLRFEATVKGNKLLTALMDIVAHPVSGFQMKRLYVELEGSDDLSTKKYVMNTCLMNYSLMLRKHDAKLYQPDTTDTHFKMLFSYSHRHGVTLHLSEFKSLKGSFYAYWKDIWAKEAILDPTFGRLPNQARVDPREEEKIRASDYAPYKNYNDLIQILVHVVLKGWALRASLEVRLDIFVC